MRRKAFAMAMVMTLTMTLPVHADQTDPRLDGLFADLHAMESVADAHPIIDRIWDIWTFNDDPNALRDMRYGIDAMNAGQFRIAIAVFTESVKRFPDFAEAWNKRATAYFIIGDYENSIADCRRVLELEPRHFGALAGLGMIFRALEEPEIALGWYGRALEVNPHLPEVKEAVRALEAEVNAKAI